MLMIVANEAGLKVDDATSWQRWRAGRRKMKGILDLNCSNLVCQHFVRHQPQLGTGRTQEERELEVLSTYKWWDPVPGGNNEVDGNDLHGGSCQ